MNKKINKAELIAEVAERNYLSLEEAKKIVDSVIDIMEEALLNDESVGLTDFGVLEVTKRKERIGANPNSHEKMVIKEKKTVSFRPYKSLKNRLNKHE